MKRIFFSLFFSMFILQGCSTVSDVYDWAFEDEEEVSTEIINQNQTQYEYVTVNIKDIIAVKWLKRQIVEWTGKDEMASWTKSTPCTEIYYSPDAYNSKYLIDECTKISKIFYDNGKVEKAAWWRGMVDMISKFDKISPRAVESIHTINWLLKNKI